MGKKSRRDRKMTGGQTVAKQKTLAERQQQIANINQQLVNLQLDERLPEIQQLSSVMRLYVEKGEPVCGKIPLSNSNKVIHYIFANRSTVDCRVNIRVAS